MVNNCLVDMAGLYVNWANTFVFIILESTYKNPPFIKVAVSSDVVLVSNYHGFKGEAIT